MLVLVRYKIDPPETLIPISPEAQTLKLKVLGGYNRAPSAACLFPGAACVN